PAAALVADPEGRELPRRLARADLQLPARRERASPRREDRLGLGRDDLLHPDPADPAARPRPDRGHASLFPAGETRAEASGRRLGVRLPGRIAAAALPHRQDLRPRRRHPTAASALMGYVGGVVAFNLVCTAVGFCVLAPAVHGLRAVTIATYAGAALLVG